MRAVKVTKSGTTLPNDFSLIQVDSDNVIIETVKKAECDDSMIIRMYEAHNKCTTATITVPKQFTSAHLCNLLEQDERPLDVIDGKIKIPVSNFEIITLRLEKGV